jgi:RHS repeat-associated protein
VNAAHNADTFYFNYTDWLGTERLRTDVSGNVVETCTSLPFGDGQNCTGALEISPMHFTGKERDAETGLDNFGARYNSSSMGRFMSPDPLGGHRIDPQTLNKYVYVRNNPVTLTDPTGLDFSLSCAQNNGTTCQNGTVYYKDKNGDYRQTLIHSDDKGNLSDQSENKYTANVSGAGVSFTGNGGTNVAGTFVNGTNATTINGSGALSGFTFNFSYSNSFGNVSAGGTFTYNGTFQQAESALGKAGFQHYGSDEYDPFHPSSLSYHAVDFRSAGDPETGAGSGHFTVEEPWMFYPYDALRSPTNGDVHLGEHNDNTSRTGLIEHAGEVARTLWWNYMVPK